jgi:glucose-6-phosphate 1-epimerase
VNLEIFSSSSKSIILDKSVIMDDSMETITLTVGQGQNSSSCTVCRFGCHVVSWKIPLSEGSFRECLWMSKLSCIDGSAPIRGGIPVAWPQFADNGPMKLHGFAREKLWAIGTRETSTTSDKITLSLSSEDCGMEDVPTKWNFAHCFTLKLTIELTLNSLSMTFTVENRGTSPLPFTGCLHTYLRTANSACCRVEGLSGLSFVDKVDGYVTKPQTEPALDIAKEMAAGTRLNGGKYFVDRIYSKAGRAGDSTLRLVDESSTAEEARVTSVVQSASWPEWVVFNPWVEGKRGDKGPDFDDDGYKYMVCLEPAVATEPVTVLPGKSWVGSQLLSV